MTDPHEEEFRELAPPPPDEQQHRHNTNLYINIPATPPTSDIESFQQHAISNDSNLFDSNPDAPSPPTDTEGISYFKSTSIAPPQPSPKPEGKPKKLRLFFSASDLLPTGGPHRIRSAYALIYLAETKQTTESPQNHKHFSHGSVITSETGGTGTIDESITTTVTSTRINPQRLSTNSSDGNNIPLQPPRNAKLLGRSERAQLCGRDVEFSRHIVLRYTPSISQILYVEVYGIDTRGNDTSTKRSYLVGSTIISLSSVYSQRGFRVSTSLTPPPPQSETTKRNSRKKSILDVGKLRITAEDVTPTPTTYHLDIMCDGLHCTKPWGNRHVKRAFYTIHVIATSDERCDDWVLAYRSDSVSMVKKKRFGGSMEYNYFSSRPLRATPGLLFTSEDDKSTSTSTTSTSTSTTTTTTTNESTQILRKLQNRLRRRYEAQFFSMPSSSFALISPNRRLKLSIWEDLSRPTGAALVADARFTMAQLREMNLGQRMDMFVHSDIVGHATLKFEERTEAPSYFCLSIQMPDLVY